MGVLSSPHQSIFSLFNLLLSFCMFHCQRYMHAGLPQAYFVALKKSWLRWMLDCCRLVYRTSSSWSCVIRYVTDTPWNRSLQHVSPNKLHMVDQKTGLKEHIFSKLGAQFYLLYYVTELLDYLNWLVLFRQVQFSSAWQTGLSTHLFQVHIKITTPYDMDILCMQHQLLLSFLLLQLWSAL